MSARGPTGEAAPRGVVRPLSVAPMMDRTDRHFRYLVRQLTRRCLLYTEMVTTGAAIHGDREHLLGYSPVEKPLALQLGGDDPAALAECARIAEGMGYDEVNLNCGCPSDRVQRGSFGASLMARPELVAEAVAAMRAAVTLPVTVKHRIGIDEQDAYEDLERFVSVVAEAGCDRFTVHARKAWLTGLSPKANRNVPPLRYEDVYRLKEARPELVIELNGGVASLEATRAHLERVDAVMIGRAAYDDPALLAGVDRFIFGDTRAEARDVREAVRAMVPYAARWMARGGRLHHVTRHMMHLFRGQPGARAWRRQLGQACSAEASRPEIITEALARVG